MFAIFKDSLNKLKNDPIGYLLEIFLKKLIWILVVFVVYKVIGLFDFKAIDSFHNLIFLIMFIVLIFVVLVVGYVAIYALKVKTENEQLKFLVESFGLKGFFPFKNKDSRAKEWNELCNYLLNNQPQTLNILALNGWDTFGCDKSPLHKFLLNFKGDLKILLIDPNCKESISRQSSLNISKENFLLDHQHTVNFCKRLKASNVNIELKMYSQIPIWKMIITDSYMWLQHYDRFIHVDENSVYEFYKDTNKTSLFYPLADVFRKRWHHDDNVEIDLIN